MIGQLNTRIEKTIASDRKRLTLIEAEQRGRPGTGTPTRRRPTAPDTDHQPAPEPPVHGPEHDRGPEL
ncbi:hypothetical protein [Rhodococcus marinonascens]|uniref:hypothetical protein n=1 Tax=Rhodococcus marinonascens TaxID=38311 RepID=UPI0009353A3E|nr:hypothetical protein [Rhodococcus marinonascens]